MDKSTWGDGPWQTEPDRELWESSGLECIMARGNPHLGSWCAYVGLPKGHPLYGVDVWEDDIEGVDVHGGFTYCGAALDQADVDPWPLGWDYSHMLDYCPASEAREREMRGESPFDRPGLHYWTYEEVQSEVEKAAKTLSEMQVSA